MDFDAPPGPTPRPPARAGRDVARGEIRTRCRADGVSGSRSGTTRPTCGTPGPARSGWPAGRQARQRAKGRSGTARWTTPVRRCDHRVRTELVCIAGWLRFGGAEVRVDDPAVLHVGGEEAQGRLGGLPPRHGCPPARRRRGAGEEEVALSIQRNRAHAWPAARCRGR